MSISVDDRFLDAAAATDELARDARTGLSGRPKSLPPRWFYDARGSELFEQITELPEYYPTRTERQILQAHADDIASAAPVQTVVELGSGSSAKTRLLLDAWQRAGSLRRIVTVDVSASALAEAAEELSGRYPGAEVRPVRADFTRHLDGIARTGRTAIVFSAPPSAISIRSSGLISSARSEQRSTPVTCCCWVPIWSSPPIFWCRHTTMRLGSRPSST